MFILCKSKIQTTGDTIITCEMFLYVTHCASFMACVSANCHWSCFISFSLSLVLPPASSHSSELDAWAAFRASTSFPSSFTCHRMCTFIPGGSLSPTRFYKISQDCQQKKPRWQMTKEAIVLSRV